MVVGEDGSVREVRMDDGDDGGGGSGGKGGEEGEEERRCCRGCFFSRRCCLFSRRCCLFSRRCCLFSRRCCLFSRRCCLFSRRCCCCCCCCFLSTGGEVGGVRRRAGRGRLRRGRVRLPRRRPHPYLALLPRVRRLRQAAPLRVPEAARADEAVGEHGYARVGGRPAAGAAAGAGRGQPGLDRGAAAAGRKNRRLFFCPRLRRPSPPYRRRPPGLPAARALGRGGRGRVLAHRRGPHRAVPLAVRPGPGQRPPRQRFPAAAAAAEAARGAPLAKKAAAAAAAKGGGGTSSSSCCCCRC